MAEKATTTPSPAPPKKFPTWIVLVIAVVIAAVVGGILYWHNHQTNKNGSTASESDWTDYKNDQYGIKFSYPTKWGPPIISQVSLSEQPANQDIPKVTDQKGKHYQINFTKQNGEQTVINITSTDFSETRCFSDGPCTTNKGFTKEDVQKILSVNTFLKGGPIKKDDSSYTNLSYNTAQGVITISQISDLGKLNATASKLTFSIVKPASSCPNNSLAAAGTPNCITENDFSNLNKLAKSLTNI
jgi:hypothetical protein